jgi:hypothetical protein
MVRMGIKKGVAAVELLPGILDSLLVTAKLCEAGDL